METVLSTDFAETDSQGMWRECLFLLPVSEVFCGLSRCRTLRSRSESGDTGDPAGAERNGPSFKDDLGLCHVRDLCDPVPSRYQHYKDYGRPQNQGKEGGNRIKSPIRSSFLPSRLEGD